MIYIIMQFIIVNIEPSKMKIMFHHPQKVIDLVDEITDEIYPPPKLEMETPLIFSNKYK